MDESQPIATSLPPKKMFLLGFVGGIMALCTVGFFILLGVMITGDDDDKRVAGNNQAGNAAVLAPSAPPSMPGGHGAPTGGGAVPPVTDADYIRGNPNAAVTLVEYSDFECPFCERFHPTAERLLEEFDGQVRWVYRHFPLSIHNGADAKAQGAECAGELGGNDAFWQFGDELFARGTSVSVATLGDIASDIGVDRAAFDECLSSGRYAGKVQQSMQGGLAAGVTGTPGSILIGPDGSTQLIPGAVPFEQIAAVVENLL